MRIAACQMVSSADKAQNIEHALRLIAAAAESGAELVVLPEHFSMVAADDAAQLAAAETFGSGPAQDAVRGAALEYGVWVVAGSIPMHAEDDRIRHALLLIDPDGAIAARYDRTHLFRYQTVSGEKYDESAVCEAGRERASFSLSAMDGRDWLLEFALGYDLRFPEIFREGPIPDLIVAPALFTETTGRAHWSTLIAARSIENQCFVAAAAQGGHHDTGRISWGHTRIVDPWGRTMNEAPRGEAVVIADLDGTLLDRVRSMMPRPEIE